MFWKLLILLLILVAILAIGGAIAEEKEVKILGGRNLGNFLCKVSIVVVSSTIVLSIFTGILTIAYSTGPELITLDSKEIKNIKFSKLTDKNPQYFIEYCEGNNSKKIVLNTNNVNFCESNDNSFKILYCTYYPTKLFDHPNIVWLTGLTLDSWDELSSRQKVYKICIPKGSIDNNEITLD